MSNHADNKRGTIWMLLNANELNGWVESKMNTGKKWRTEKQMLGGANRTKSLIADDGDVFHCIWAEFPKIETLQRREADIKAYANEVRNHFNDATGMLVFWKFPCVDAGEVIDYFFYFNQGFNGEDIDSAVSQMSFEKMVRNGG